MAKKGILEFSSSGEPAGEETAMLDPVIGELTGSDSEVEEIVEIGDAESGDESSSSSDDEEDVVRAQTSKDPPNRLDGAQVVEIAGVDHDKRKRGEEDEDGSGSTDDESGESDAQAALLDEAEPPSAGPSPKKKRKSTAKEKPISALTPPPTPRKSGAKRYVKGSEGRDEVANVEDNGTSDGRPSVGGPQPKSKRGGKKKQADTIVAKTSSSSPAKPRGRPRKTASKDPKAPNNADVLLPQGQSKSAEGGGITAGEIGIIFETLTAEADWAAIVAKTNALIGLKRLGQNVSKHWKTIAKKRLLDAYGA
ncbi:hypothetical protein C7212DRAFT_361842 [Tuber magnatum]|uniref:Uncharacterized protein n=1 Tax=Tuber magnatum TaxID=42249 RepID=A0A317SXL9_9PEZI|nr:hypothetical protein C7212DRAFT_361842 [Tuber magnatum]